MTLRRWQSKRSKKIPQLEMEMILNGLFALVGEGFLPVESPQLQKILEENHKSSAYISSVLKTLGLGSIRQRGLDFPDQIVSSLQIIGALKSKQDYVDSKLNSWPAMIKNSGRQLEQKVAELILVIKSTKISKKQKVVAYGALFYLFLPFDFIPDHIPVFGLLDDFAVLGFALSYYNKLAVPAGSPDV